MSKIEDESANDIDDLKAKIKRLETIMREVVLALDLSPDGTRLWMDYIDPPDEGAGGWIVEQDAENPPNNSIKCTGLYQALRALWDAVQESEE